LESSGQHPPKLRLLRVFNVVATALVYCAQNAGRLVTLVWFPCVALVACQVTLDWLALSYPPQLPGWLLTRNYNPPTWLTPIVVALWTAMASAFILSDLADRNSNRGLAAARILRRGRLRFELGRDVLLAAAIFSAAILLDGALRVVQLKILVALYVAFDLPDATLNIWAGLGEAIQVLVMAAMYATCYLVAGRLLLTGSLDVPHTWKLTQRNRLRLIAVFLLLSLAASALDRFTTPVINWLVQSFADSISWSLRGALIRYLADVPFLMLWTVVDAVAVGIVLDALEPRQASADPASRVTERA
jgi:hypothetical protein